MFDTMHIRKNVVETLWRILDIQRDKEKNIKICNDIQEANHAMKYVIQLHSNKDQVNIKSLPSLLSEQEINFVKEVR